MYNILLNIIKAVFFCHFSATIYIQAFYFKITGSLYPTILSQDEHVSFNFTRSAIRSNHSQNIHLPCRSVGKKKGALEKKKTGQHLSTTFRKVILLCGQQFAVNSQ